MSAEAFDQFTRNDTFVYAQDGRAYGAEQYLDDRKVRWQFLDGDCIDGYWYPMGDLICFAYEDDGATPCWHFYESGSQMVAALAKGPETEPRYTAQRTAEPLHCLGPEIGVRYLK